MPQFFGSEAVLVQLPGLPALAPQMISLFGHAWHALPEQLAPTAHALPHALQLFASLVRSAHVPAPGEAPTQSVVPFGHAQMPEMHAAP